MKGNCWLFKTEPGSYSWDDLVAEEDSRTMWDGIRNYQARNLMRDEMEPGDPVLCTVPRHQRIAVKAGLFLNARTPAAFAL